MSDLSAEARAKRNEARRLWRQRNREKIRAHRRAYKKAHHEKIAAERKIWKKNNPDKVKLARRIYRKIYRKRQPEKTKARRYVERAVKYGRLKRPNTCSMCLKACIPHGHHEDYSKPLEVIWVCQPCHKEIHARGGSHK